MRIKRPVDQIDRRNVLKASMLGCTALTLPAILKPTFSQVSGEIEINITGQALMVHDVTRRDYQYEGYAALRNELQGATLSFTNLESSIAGPGLTESDQPQNVVSSLEILRTLQDLDFNILSLANNHADDLGEPGILSTIRAVEDAGFGHAGTGSDLAHATAPGYYDFDGGRAALVACASGALDEEAFATNSKPGVSHLSVDRGAVNLDDVSRILASIREAKEAADFVVMYHHDHYWAADWQDTPAWKKWWARQCIDAGADVFVGHGVPIVHGIEIHNGKPIFYGLGNFIFHLSYYWAAEFPPHFEDRRVWQSVIAKCRFSSGRLASLRLVPVALDEQLHTKRLADNRMLSGPTGNPNIVTGWKADLILSRISELSDQYGTQIRLRSDSQADVLVDTRLHEYSRVIRQDFP